MKKFSLLLVVALLGCLVYSCSKDDDGPYYVSYLSGTFTPGGSQSLVCTVDGASVTSGEVKLTVDTDDQSKGVMALNGIVPGVGSLSVDVAIAALPSGDDTHDAGYEITGEKTVDGKTVSCTGVLATDHYSESGRVLTLVVTTK